ncbi:hypothetical protein IGL98_001119 [Enterococcus sp. DIV0840]|uniref:putative mucin/carbohydrate-binding domain-containing protein n=1 Tax=unclassified Enterococcus TaxID=2608891 RepID=UPI001A8DD423|nr:putative mucin/carbohydrate-binding domain-containing protein [Enterococcus sp. DIV0849a]MBO0434664.1 hypothetical protein [Enterococcus sp. DIV0849a]
MLKQVPALWNSSIYQSNEKKNLRLAIEMLSEPTKTQYMEKYSELFPVSQPENDALFNYTFKGISDVVFATMDISLKEHQVIVDTENKQPHWYFENKIYASITIQDKDGVEKYTKKYEGRKTYSAAQDKVTLVVGDYITVYHAENKDRLMIQNQATNEILAKKETVTCQVMENGLKMVETNTIPKPRPEHGELFNYTFKGIGDIVFATMDISLKEHHMIIETKNKQPHWYFENEIYASITIQDKDGVEKFTKDYEGRQTYTATQARVLLDVGDYITVYHAESKDRLMIQNQVTKEILEKKETVTYQVTENGLRLL